MPNVDPLSYAIWVITILLYSALAVCLVYRRALKRWTWLTLFSAISSLAAIALLCLYVYGAAAGYFWTYWAERFALGACHFGIIWEISTSLLSANRHWRRQLIQAMLGLTVLTLAVSAVISFSARRPLYVDVMQLTNLVDRWLSLAACAMFVAMAFSLDGMGIRWRRETLLVGLGLAVQGALFTTFAWYISIRALTQAEMALPSLIRDLVEIVTVVIWISAFASSPKPDSYAAMSADRLRSILKSMKSVVAGV